MSSAVLPQHGCIHRQSLLHATTLPPLSKHRLIRRVRLVSLAAQNFLAGVINDTLQACRKCGTDLF